MEPKDGRKSDDQQSSNFILNLFHKMFDCKRDDINIVAISLLQTTVFSRAKVRVERQMMLAR